MVMNDGRSYQLFRFDHCFLKSRNQYGEGKELDLSMTALDKKSYRDESSHAVKEAVHFQNS